MECKGCGRQLRIGKTYMTFKNDDTPETPTEAFQNLEMLCLNPKCSNFSGDKETKDIALDNPVSVFQVVTNKIN